MPGGRPKRTPIRSPCPSDRLPPRHRPLMSPARYWRWFLEPKWLRCHRAHILLHTYTHIHTRTLSTCCSADTRPKGRKRLRGRDRRRSPARGLTLRLGLEQRRRWSGCVHGPRRRRWRTGRSLLRGRQAPAARATQPTHGALDGLRDSAASQRSPTWPRGPSARGPRRVFATRRASASCADIPSGMSLSTVQHTRSSCARTRRGQSGTT